jgi:hypothetical protein
MNTNFWQPIETAPKDGTPIICWSSQIKYEYGIVIGEYIPEKIQTYNGIEYTNIGVWVNSNLKNRNIKPTHWMHLPDLPKQ